MLFVVQVFVVIADDVDRIDPRAVPPAERGALYQWHGDLEFPEPFAAVIKVVVSQPDEALIPPLHPVKMFAAVGLKTMAHAVPGLQFDVRCQADRSPGVRAPGQQPKCADQRAQDETASQACVFVSSYALLDTASDTVSAAIRTSSWVDLPSFLRGTLAASPCLSMREVPSSACPGSLAWYA